MRKAGLQLKQLPKKYPITDQQQRFIAAALHCGIKKGITKQELMDKMINCIPEYYKKDGKDD